MPRKISRALAFAALASACASARPAARPAPVPTAVGSAPLRERHASSRAIAAYLRARLAEGSGNRAAALEALRLALVHDPESPQLRISYAEALARSGQVGRAEAEARRAVELAPQGAASVDAHLALGRTLALARRTREAVAELRAAAALEAALSRGRVPGSDDQLDPDPWRLLVRVQLDAGDLPGALTACEDLATLNRAQGAAGLREVALKLLADRDVAGAEPPLRRAIELAPADADGWKLQAKLEEARGRLPEARAAWERAVAADPDDADALLASGELALRAGDPSAGRAWLQRFLDVAADELGARARVAAAWLDAKRPQEALEATSARDEDARLLYLRGVALQALQRWGEAADAYRGVAPASGELYEGARIGLAHALARAGKPAEGVRALQRALEARPASADLLYALGEAYERAGQRAKALAQMRAVLAVKADHADALNFLGYSFAERGERLEEAQALVERALAVEPENGYYLDSLGWVLYRRGELKRAVEALERASAIVGPEATILDHLGDAYRAAARPADAAAAYRRALDAAKLGAGDPDVTPSSRAAIERKLHELAAQPERSRPAARR